MTIACAWITPFSDESLLTLGMNGKTLSRTHGFPIRLLAPNYYGCRNVKWLREIRFVTHPYYGTWQRLGYTKEPIIHICSHIDHVRRDGPLVEFGGVSFAGSRGIKRCGCVPNAAPWQPARLEPALSPYTWTRWAAQLVGLRGRDPGSATHRTRPELGRNSSKAALSRAA